MKKFGIYKRERITIQNEILEVFNKGRKFSDKYIKIFIFNNDRGYVRFAVTINKKFGNAVQRNRAKRHLRELFRLNKDLYGQGFDIIFFIKNEFKILSYKEKNRYFINLLSKAGCLKE